MIPELASIAQVSPKADPKEVAAKVQGMFMEIMLKAMEESVDAEDGLFGTSLGADIYRGMLRQHLAAAMSQTMQNPLQDALAPALSSTEGKVKAEEGMPVSGVMTSPEGWRRDPLNGEPRYHSGTDIAAPEGTPIRAVAEGRVIESGVKGSYGNIVVIQAEDGREMLYAHNSRNLVRVGDWVSQGEAIAEVGSSGRTTGPHLHFEVKF